MQQSAKIEPSRLGKSAKHNRNFTSCGLLFVTLTNNKKMTRPFFSFGLFARVQLSCTLQSRHKSGNPAMRSFDSISLVCRCFICDDKTQPVLLDRRMRVVAACMPKRHEHHTGRAFRNNFGAYMFLIVDSRSFFMNALYRPKSRRCRLSKRFGPPISPGEGC
jgi:hypothetical protein